MRLHNALLKSLVLVLICAISMNGYAKGSSGSKSRSMSGGFKAAPRSAPAPKAAPAPKPQQKPSAAPAAKTTMGSFGSNKTTTTNTTPNTKSALAADMTKSAAQANALKTMDSRKALAAGAVVGAGAAVVVANSDSNTPKVAPPAPANSNFDTSGYNDRAATTYRSGYSNQQSPQTVVVKQDSGIVPAVAGYMAGQAVANANNRQHNYDRQQSGSFSGTPIVNQDVAGPASTPPVVSKAVTPVKQETSSGGFFWGLLKALFYIAAIGGIIYGVKVFMDKRAAANRANYSLGDI